MIRNDLFLTTYNFKLFLFLLIKLVLVKFIGEIVLYCIKKMEMSLLRKNFSKINFFYFLKFIYNLYLYIFIYN